MLSRSFSIIALCRTEGKPRRNDLHRKSLAFPADICYNTLIVFTIPAICRGRKNAARREGEGLGFLNYDGPLMTLLRKIGCCLIANALFLLCSVPLFTAGASLCSLYYVVEKNLKRDRSYPWRAFFACFRRNWRQTLPAGAVIAGIGVVFFLDVQILRMMAERGSLIGNLYVVFYLLGAVLLVYAVWLFAMIARFENSLRGCLRNACILMLRHLPTSILVLLLWGFFGAVIYILPLSLLICPALAAWLSSAFLERCFAGYLTEEQRAALAEQDREARGGPED